MKVRYPDFDFSDMTPHWASNPEAAQCINASHLVPAYIEPFLIKVMRRAKAELDPTRDAELIADIDVFNKQEGQHTKLHGGYMRMLRSHGYDGMAEIEQRYAGDYERFLETKSLRFLLAYCDAFEAVGSAIAPTWVDGEMDDALEGADERALGIWKWHLGEEYEHRTVVFRTYERLYGKPAVRSYLYRVALFLYCGVHLGKHVGRLRKYLLATDRAGMSASELAASKARQKAAPSPTGGRANIRRMLRPFSPVYDPAKVPPPRCLDAVLAEYG